jgi:histidyl-tRNA synthetase
MGLERLILLLETLELIPEYVNNHADVYVTAMGDKVTAPALALSEMLRNSLPGKTVITHCGGGSFKSQMKKADRSGARYAVILGENELATGTVGLKPLRSDEPQQDVGQADLAGVLEELLGR